MSKTIADITARIHKLRPRAESAFTLNEFEILAADPECVDDSPAGLTVAEKFVVRHLGKYGPGLISAKTDIDAAGTRYCVFRRRPTT